MSDSNNSIKAINASEHIRLRPSMYVGSVNKYGIHNLLIEVLQTLTEKNSPKTEIIFDLTEEIVQLKFKNTILNQAFSTNPENALKIMTEFGPLLSSETRMNIVPALSHLTSYYKVQTDNSDIIILNKREFDFNPCNIEKEDWLRISFTIDDEIFEETNFSREILHAECEKLAALSSNVSVQLIDSRNGSNYNEKFVMNKGLLQLFKNKIDRLDSANYINYRWNSANVTNFHTLIKFPEISLEVIFMPSNYDKTFEYSYYRFLNLTEGGSHIVYFKMRLAELNKKLNANIESYNNDLTCFHLMTNIETEQEFPFVGPTKTQIEDPVLVQIMKSAFDELEPKIISFFTNNSTRN